MTSYIAILGRQPALGLAELERLYGAPNITRVNQGAALLTATTPPPFGLLGGTVKLAELVERRSTQNYMSLSKAAVTAMVREYSSFGRKLTLGISAYGFDIGPRDVQKTGLVIKARLKSGASVRLIPNTEPALSSAQSYHNNLGSDNKVELLLVRGDDGASYIATLTSVQDIDFYTERDRKKPFRDALNGMLPPKLAQTMINLAAGPAVIGPRESRHALTVLDPFCGSGTVLIEGMFHGFNAYGTDVSPKMVAHSNGNTDWFGRLLAADDPVRVRVGEGDATKHSWKPPYDFIASETFLGEPMAQEPKPEKLQRVMDDCERVIRGFLANFAGQAPAGTPLCIAVPAWRTNGQTRHLPVVDDLEDLGYNWIDFEHVSRSDLLYYREDQIVARELLILRRS